MDRADKSQNPVRKFTILVAEDDDGDFFILQRAVAKAKFSHPIFRSPDGQSAIDYLAGSNPFSDRLAYPFPSLFILDLKMPLKHGFEVLRWLRNESPTCCRLLPTLLLSSSNHPDDVELGYQLGANAFLTKPTSTDDLVSMISSIDAFWVNHNSASNRRLDGRLMAAGGALA